LNTWERNSLIDGMAIEDTFMTGRLTVSLALGILALTDACVQAQPGGRRSELQAIESGWLFSLEQGKAQKTGKPLMVVVRCVP
jgi:hypothetical protein